MRQYEISGPTSLLVAALASLQLGAGYVALKCQGRAIEMFLSRSSLARVLAAWLAVSVLAKLLSIGANLALEAFRALWVQRQGEAIWRENFPSHIPRAREKDSESLFLALTQDARWVLDQRLQRRMHFLSMLIVGGFCLVASLVYKFYLGLAIFGFVGLASFLSSRIGAGRIERASGRQLQTRQELLRWVREHFMAFREIRHCWLGRINLKDWPEQRAAAHLAAERHLTKEILSKSLLSQLFVELPCALAIAALLWAAFKGVIPFNEALAWFGLTQYVVSAVSGLMVMESMRPRVLATEAHVQALLRSFAISAPMTSLTASNDISGTFQLGDGMRVTLSLEPGLHLIRGRNGCGKSSLLEALTGAAEPHASFSGVERESVARFRSVLSAKNVRLIERESVAFSHLPSFNAQIWGAEFDPPPNFFSEKLANILPAPLALNWQTLLSGLADRWSQREASDLSSGERVCLSLARALASWNDDIKLVIVDESEAPLDAVTRVLFENTLCALAERVAIFWISHSEPSPRVSDFTLLACDPSGQRGTAIAARLLARCAGTGLVHGKGTIGTVLVGELQSVLRILADRDPALGRRLPSIDFQLEAERAGATLGCMGSAGLALAAAVYDVIGQFDGHARAQPFAATGYIEMDGAVSEVQGLQAKRREAMNMGLAAQRIFTPDQIKNILELRGLCS